MATGAFRARYTGPDKVLYGVAGIAQGLTCLGDKDCEERLAKRGRTADRWWQFVPAVSEGTEETEYWCSPSELIIGKYIWDTDEYPDLPN